MAQTGKTGSSKQAWIIGSLVFVASGVALYFLFKEFKKTKFYLQKKLVSIYKNHPTWEVNNQIGSKANPTTQLAGIYKISGKRNAEYWIIYYPTGVFTISQRGDGGWVLKGKWNNESSIIVTDLVDGHTDVEIGDKVKGKNIEDMLSKIFVGSNISEVAVPSK